MQAWLVLNPRPFIGCRKRFLVAFCNSFCQHYPQLQSLLLYSTFLTNVSQTQHSMMQYSGCTLYMANIGPQHFMTFIARPMSRGTFMPDTRFWSCLVLILRSSQNKFYSCNSQVHLLSQRLNKIATAVNYTCKSFIELTPGFGRSSINTAFMAPIRQSHRKITTV